MLRFGGGCGVKTENKSGCEQQEKLCTAYLWGCKNCRYVTTDCYKLKDKEKKKCFKESTE